MDLEYDCKFEEMKKYIPFLESMITRLESNTSKSSNPRQAQLDKIRSLRDLLQDKKKRMKMENLLKCEQVLVNLYAKVEQKDSLPSKSTELPYTTKKEESNLESVRKKLQSVTARNVPEEETLPEISRASEIEETCTPGSKEPALFQRRPNKLSVSPSRSKLSASPSRAPSLSKRNYTRVLVSPEPSSRRWSDQDSKADTPLFTRRSPTRRSPKRSSPSRDKKKERKKGSKQEKIKKTKGLNITLNVPEESLDSLNTEDILSRIMNCNDNDMDIETLREAKRQILSELNQTGAKYDDISDLLLKSYKGKSGKSRNKKKDEVEEGELSDSESEAIESIYGGLNSSPSKVKKSDDKELPRKIQICLVINPEDGKASDSGQVSDPVKKPLETDPSDFEMYGEKVKSIEINTSLDIKSDGTQSSQHQNEIVDNTIDATKTENTEPTTSEINSKDISNKPANFYKPMKDQDTKESNNKPGAESDLKAKTPSEIVPNTENTEKTTTEKLLLSPQKNKDNSDVLSVNPQNSSDETATTETKDVEIPLLHEKGPTMEKPKKDVVSEIDILQALKNEILSETISIPGSEAATPALHQPKLKKVICAQEIAPKKRISIEKYKEKSILKPKTTTPLFLKESSNSSKEDCSKKQSRLKLTMKECERFNFPTKLALDDDDSCSSDDNNKNTPLDVYGDLDVAPKSPDNDDSYDVPCTPPVIIPVDPVKTTAIVMPSKQDVDMRTLPLSLPIAVPNPISSPGVTKTTSISLSTEAKKQKESVPFNVDKPKALSDPRTRREQSMYIEGTPFPLIVNQERGHPTVPMPGFPNMTPNRTPNMTPIINPSMTPNAKTFEVEDKKHVYTPMFSSYDPRERENSIAKDYNTYKPEIDKDSRTHRRDPDRNWDNSRSGSIHRDGPDYHKSRFGDSKYHKNTRYNIDRRESMNRSECPLTPIHPFGRSDGPATSSSFGIPSLLEAPITPVHPFGRSDCPLTPSHPFGRSECPPTPIHPFGRNDCPLTPNHPFGRSECLTAQNHPFDRSECPLTPSHPFGRGDMPMTPNHPFGRSDNTPRDPRLNRSTDYEKYQRNDREYNSYREYRERNSSGYKQDNMQNKSYDGPESYRQYREKGDNRSERYKYSSRDRSGQYNKESMHRREPSVGRGGRAVSKEVDNEQLYFRDRRQDHFNQNDNSSSSNDFGPRRGFYRERSIGRSGPDERNYRSSSRASSVGRTLNKHIDTDNRLSVKPDAGRSFTIDTSVNSTFQDFLDGKKIQVFDYSFNNRRQRASSVGRTLIRESSVGRTLTHVGQQIEVVDVTKRLDFRRASSVGRDIVGKEDKSFKDIKADFERFKVKTSNIKTKPIVDQKAERPVKEKGNKIPIKETNVSDFGNRKSRKDTFENKIAESTKKPYSPRKNYRDPRLRREPVEGSGKKSDERDHKHVGIVYSSDNITKGTILGSGYGVKNYKIPKIKRPVEEKEVLEKIEPIKKKEIQKTDLANKGIVNKTDTFKQSADKDIDKKAQKKEIEIKAPVEKADDKNKDKNVKVSKIKKPAEKVSDKKTKELNKSVNDSLLQKTDILENVEKRVTRLSRRSEKLVQPVKNVKAKVYKKVVINDSDSDEENSKESENKMTTEKLKDKEGSKPTENLPNTTDENSQDSQSADQMDSSFGIDDLEMFPDNIVSDPVIDNINALIADLDNELGPTKLVTPTDFSNDLIENMLESITNEGKEDTKSLNEDDKLNDISEVISNDLNQSGASFETKDDNAPVIESATNNLFQNVSQTATNVDVAKDIVSSPTKDVKSIDKDSQINLEPDTKSKPDDQTVITPINNDESNSDDVVTTTDTDKLQVPDKLEDKKGDQSDVDGRSTPDSTNEIVSNRLSQESVPDSTNNVQEETNSSIVSSTHDTVETTIKDSAEPSSSNKDPSSLNSIGSILDILQNKSKIKELLSFLGDQVSDNEKIKKKLEKLSEIVSDEEDEMNNSGDKADMTLKDMESKDLPQKDCENKDENVNKEGVASNSEITPESIDKKDPKDLNEEVHAEEKCDTPEKSKETEKKDDIETKIHEVIEKDEEITLKRKIPTKKVSFKRRRGGKLKKIPPKTTKRVTRSNVDAIKKPIKKQSRELLKLQQDIKEMFMKDDILNATGIRMCRLAKLVDDKKEKEEPTSKDSAPMVVIEKDKTIETLEEALLSNKPGRKKGKLAKKLKTQELSEIEKKINKAKPLKYKAGPKSKTKAQKQIESDPYEFESDSVSDMTTDETNDQSVDGKEDSSGSDSESLASSKSYESTEVLNDFKKKPKRKRSGWQSGVIKSRTKKKKAETKQTDSPSNDDIPITSKSTTIPDYDCFIDKTYCFQKNVTEYSCRLCVYSGDDIVAHYKENHPHSEIPLSRMDPQIAKEAIEQCGEINFQTIRKIPTDKYVCRFCYKEFLRKKKNILELFFWHIVSVHTGEYKKNCSECVNVACPFNLDIPPPPKDVKGQLIGYICEKCNFTQISLENLKTHVIHRHNDEQTEVYTINLAVMTRKTINKLLKQYNASNTETGPRVLRSTRSNQSVTETSDDHCDEVTDSDTASGSSSATRIKRVKKRISSPSIKQILPTPSKTKITYENDDSQSDASRADSVTTVKIERDTGDDVNEDEPAHSEMPAPCDDVPASEDTAPTSGSDDIFDYPHFKISYTDAGLKEYVCCINGKESHYKTTLLISMKKHVQTKHSEPWDGYCFVCKVIVTPQGQHHIFKECLQHFLDKHMDNFPVLEKLPEISESLEAPIEVPSKSYINVRPISELISTNAIEPAESEIPILPKIESIVSLGIPTERVASPNLTTQAEPEETPIRYEEVQMEVMSKKHQVVLDSMMRPEKLINVYKCAGRFCSFTSDSVEDALLHASTHNRVGGDGSLTCSYCSFDCSGNAIDLVMHVFKSHGACPFVCGFCFYRSAAQQLVVAHTNKMHPGQKHKVLASTVPPPTAASYVMLPRDVVVRYYVCPHACKYRTYTAQKFCEHLAQRHTSVTWHSCYICSESFMSSMELVQHMKLHDMNVYQCTWCVHGADNEANLLAHTAATHPDKHPQAYLRLITTKDGSKEFRVLPLASFNKHRTEVEKVTPGSTKDNPVREAERSIELEKLIGHTAQMIELATPAQASPKPEEQPLLPESDQVPPRVETPPMSVEEKSRMPTPVLKKEPEDPDTTNRKLEDIVYCLDSDEEQTKTDPEPKVIDLSTDDAPAQADKATSPDQTETVYKKLPIDKVLKCPECFCSFRNVGGFKRHTNACMSNQVMPVACAHCNIITKNRDELIFHYTVDHCEMDLSTCGVCNEKFPSVISARKHLKDAHRIRKMVVSAKTVSGNNSEYTVVPVKPSPSKRKLSAAGPEPPSKMKKYGPNDVDRLPINPILDELVHCSLCEFNTKVRLNMVRHLQFHADQQPVPHSAPINPVPHLETNEKHFDRMVNLASSSIVTRAPDRPQAAHVTVTSDLSADLAGKYPKLLDQKYACGAKDCSYISVSEELFKCHWNTLHAADQYRCVHCSTATSVSGFENVLEHIKMHDSTLYGCSACSYYHYKREVVASHAGDVHKGSAKIVAVREEVEAAVQGGQPAPTMDLKPWQCGLCEYKSLLRQEIIEHCGKSHQSKMQYKCSNCPFRTSTLENVTKHMTNSHPGKSHEVFYYFYREGTVPDDQGVPCWRRQRQKMGIADSSDIKTEVSEPATLADMLTTQKTSVSAPAVDLNIVKKEAEELDLSLDMLCQKYGQFCEPNGLNYKCPLCLVVMEDTRDAMQSHLYEELRYRRWMCGACSYKAYHSVGLNEHIISDHHGQNQSPLQLAPDISIEMWVSSLLDHQAAAITKNKESLAKQKIMTERPPRPSKPEEPPKQPEQKAKPTMAELEKAFGPLGVPSNMVYCCPKCNLKIKDESSMRNHLESELTKIRWCCSKCSGTFQTYHEAQFHCKSAHAGLAASPREAQRDPAARAAWLDAVLQVQKLSMRCLPLSSEPVPTTAPAADADNSLLVVRYEERVPTPEETVRRAPAPAPAPGPAQAVAKKKTTPLSKCPHCDFQSKYPSAVSEHIYRHYNLKPFSCQLCDFTGHKTVLQSHVEAVHRLEYRLELVKKTELPSGPPLVGSLATRGRRVEETRLVCLACETDFTEADAEHHRHPAPERQAVFVKRGKVVVRCCVCHTLWADVPVLRSHYLKCHSGASFNYVFHKLTNPKSVYCGHCDKRFPTLRDLRAHNADHSPLPVSAMPTPSQRVRPSTGVDVDDDDVGDGKRKADDSDLPPPKRIARKSTTKLPFEGVARKSTTKLPYSDQDCEEEYSFYGTRPAPIEEYKNVTTLMSFCNTMVPFTMDKLNGVLNINPRVVVVDVKKGDSSIE